VELVVTLVFDSDDTQPAAKSCIIGVLYVNRKNLRTPFSRAVSVEPFTS
jgi:hypothetical protein